ncbi:MAG: DNRLRE domain-containing protein [Phycisphaerae bacterium]|nr:DNRLRE domain-containing protein [Phycisphaerae bacterium]
MKHVIAAVAVAAGAHAACGDSITIVAHRDNTLYESAAGALSNGQGAHVFAGTTRLGEVRRAVLRFDLGGIPAGSTIESARLVLTMDRTGTPGAGFALHRLLADWGEGASNAGDPGGLGAAAAPGDATWLHRSFSDVFWTIAGGDFAAAPSASASVGALGPVQWGPAVAMTLDTQAWLDNPAQNHGWLVKAADESLANAKRFHSRESILADGWPRLIVEFTPPPPCPGQGPGACAPADWNEDGVVDFNDLLEFLNAFNAADPCADLNADGVVDFNDFLGYLNLFNLGC